jgi:hypothetical protein
MQMLIREQVKDNFWINQKLLINGQENLVELLVNPANGEILKMIVNGDEKEIPENPEMEVVATENVDITVPAGTYATLHVTLQEKGTDKVTDTWLNQTEIPVSGMVKTIQPSQFGKVKIDLTGSGRG